MAFRNVSGIVPLEYRALVYLDPVEEKTASGIIMPDVVREKEGAAATRATLMAVGGNCFEDWRDARKPEPGDAVLVSKYAGQLYKGLDGKEYRVCNDKDIAALLIGQGEQGDE